MPFEPRLFSGADGNMDGSADGNLAGAFDRNHFVDPAAAESGRHSAMRSSAAQAPEGTSGPRQRPPSELPTRGQSRERSWLRSVAADSESDADLELPDQLAMLAAQLRDEADVLAAQHAPPEVKAVAPIADRDRVRHVWRYAAVALVGLGLIAWHSLASHDRPLPNAGTNLAGTAAAHDASPTKTNLASRVSELSAAGPQGETKVSTNLVATAPSKLPTASHSGPASSDPQALRANQGIEEVIAGQPPVARHPPADELEMLHRQVEGFDKLIHRLQAELAARDAAQAENEKLIQSLRQENEQLRHRQQARAPESVRPAPNP